tara:strand:+ start:160 stop:318 length:159 start_codon:yes stop_codon:yes gene_type:complete
MVDNIEQIKSDSGSSYLLKNVPKNIYRHFAGMVKMKGKTIRQVLIEFMEDYK